MPLKLVFQVFFRKKSIEWKKRIKKTELITFEYKNTIHSNHNHDSLIDTQMINEIKSLVGYSASVLTLISLHFPGTVS